MVSLEIMKQFHQNRTHFIASVRRFSALILLFIVASCGQKVNWDDERTSFVRQGDFLLYHNQPFTGTLQSYYDVAYRQLKRTQSYRQGLPHGKMIEYYKSGLLKEETTYQRGLKNGESKLYHENGIVKKMLSYRMGTLNP